MSDRQAVSSKGSRPYELLVEDASTPRGVVDVEDNSFQGTWYNFLIEFNEDVKDKDPKHLPFILSEVTARTAATDASASALVGLEPDMPVDHCTCCPGRVDSDEFRATPAGSGFPESKQWYIEDYKDRRGYMVVHDRDKHYGIYLSVATSIGSPVDRAVDVIRYMVEVSPTSDELVKWMSSDESVLPVADAKKKLYAFLFEGTNCRVRQFGLSEEEVLEVRSKLDADRKFDKLVTETVESHKELKLETDADCDFFSDVADKCFLLSLCNFITMPVAYLLALYQQAYLIYIYIVAKFAFSMFAQRHVAKMVAQRLKSMSGEDVQLYVKVAEGDVVQMTSALTCSDLCFLALRSVGLLFDASLKTVEAVDPDFDSATAGSSWLMLSSAQKKTFAASWAHVPVFNIFVARFNLPGVLTLHLICVTLLQLKNCAKGYHGVKKDMLLKTRWRRQISTRRKEELRSLWNLMYYITDIGGLMLLTKLFMDLDKIQRGKYPMDRAGSFIQRVMYETLPALWFQISLFGLSFEWATKFQLMTTLGSIGTSFLAAFVGVYDLMPWMVQTIRDGRVGRAAKSWFRCEEGFEAQVLVFLMGMALFLPYQILRLVGVFTCESHIFNLSELGCMPVPGSD